MLKRPSQEIVVLLGLLLAVAACGGPSPLTAEKAKAIVGERSLRREPVYAEVPQRVWWNRTSPQDDYDRLAIRTLVNLERAGLVTVSRSESSDAGEWTARATAKGFPILGTAPSARGPVFRGRICEKKYDGLRNFVRHPSDPTVGSAELVWHYDDPTALYPLFETRIDKPLRRPYASLISFRWEDHQWKFDVMVAKSAIGG